MSDLGHGNAAFRRHWEDGDPEACAHCNAARGLNAQGLCEDCACANCGHGCPPKPEWRGFHGPFCGHSCAETYEGMADEGRE